MLESSVVIDIVRMLHLIGVALGLGLALYADISFLGRLTNRIDRLWISEIERLHRFVGRALLLLWISGLALAYVRTGFEPEAISPKLAMKGVVVTALTLNAMAIGFLALPRFHWALGQSYAEMSFGDRIILAWIGGVSAACWMSALALGTVGLLKTLPGDMLIALFLGTCAVTLSGATLCAIIAGAFREEREPHRVEPSFF